MTDTQAYQIEMDKIAEEFKALHEERKKLIKQWEETVTAIKLRDEQLAQVGE